MSQNDYRNNENAPAIRFIRVHGRVIPIVKGKKIKKAAPLVEGRLQDMAGEVKHAEASGKSYSAINGRSFGGFSSYPSFYKDLKFRNKADFAKALAGKTSKSDDLAKLAINDLTHGYNSTFGHVPADMGFRVMTRQSFDNRNVIFRKIDGVVRPIRLSKKEFKFSEEVPF